MEGEAEHLALHHQVGAARAARPRHELLLEVVLPRAGAARLRDAKEDVVVERACGGGVVEGAKSPLHLDSISTQSRLNLGCARAVGGGGKGVGLARVVVVLWVVAEHLGRGRGPEGECRPGAAAGCGEAVESRGARSEEGDASAP